jgi:hypothetical protein
MGFDKEFIPCFGCSFTYGADQLDTESWPYLLSQETNKNFLNLGMGGSGIDGVYNNLKLLYQKHKFNQCVILFPNFERRIVRSQIQDLWIRMHSTVDIFETNNIFHFYTNKNLVLVNEMMMDENINPHIFSIHNIDECQNSLFAIL